jgi:hypothetical protein
MPLTFSGDSVEDKSPDKYGYVSEDVGFANHVMMLKRLSEAMSAPSAPKAESTAFDSEHPSVH